MITTWLSRASYSSNEALTSIAGHSARSTAVGFSILILTCQPRRLLGFDGLYIGFESNEAKTFSAIWVPNASRVSNDDPSSILRDVVSIIGDIGVNTTCLDD